METPLDVQIEGIYGMVPVQAEGVVNGHPFYFRSRGSRWSLTVAAAPGGSVWDTAAWRYEEGYGPWPEAGYMPVEEARAKIAQALWRWSEQNAELPAD